MPWRRKPRLSRSSHMKPLYVTWAGSLALLIGTAWGQGNPTDPQIAAIVVTANQVDIDAGKLAKSKAQSQQVKDFAQTMITDHSGVNQSATELVQKLHVTPQSNATSESLKHGGEQNLTALRKLNGSAFDKA